MTWVIRLSLAAGFVCALLAGSYFFHIDDDNGLELDSAHVRIDSRPLQGETVAARFVVSNRANRDAHLLSARTSCGCTRIVTNHNGNSQELPVDIPPGQHRPLILEIDTTGRQGLNTFSFQIQYAIGKKEMVLDGTVDVEIRAGWQVTPRSLEFAGIQPGEVVTKRLVVTDGMDAGELVLSSATSSDPDLLKVEVAELDTALEPLPMGAAVQINATKPRYYVYVSCTVKDSAVRQEWIRLIPSRSDVSPYEVPVYCCPVEKPFRVKPDLLVIPPAEVGTQFRRDIQINSPSKSEVHVEVIDSPVWIKHRLSSEEAWRKAIGITGTVPNRANKEHEIVLRINGQRHVCRIILLAGSSALEN